LLEVVGWNDDDAMTYDPLRMRDDDFAIDDAVHLDKDHFR
jgi:hypothetical protein